MKLSGFLSNESTFGRVCTRIGTVILVNLMFVLTLLPVVTAGAGLCALYSCMLKLVRYKEINPLIEFVDAFKENFKTATLGWLASLALAAFLFVDIRIGSQMSGAMHAIVYVLYLIAIMLLVTVSYLFPVMASFEGKLKACIRNSLFFAGTSPLQTLGILLVTLLPLAVTYRYNQLMPLWAFLWSVFGFAAVALVHAHMLLPRFEKYLDPLDTEPEDEDERRILEEMRKLGM